MFVEFGWYFYRLINSINILCLHGLFRLYCIPHVRKVKLPSVSQGRHWVQFYVHWLFVEFLLACDELGGD